ncbi:MAG TPA: CCA tRNA nucleotidyltransferase, partial [Chthoniobacterales bacterium]
MNAVTPMEKTAREIAARLRARGHVAYFAGGCVRDLLRGEISKDIDIATDARPEVVREMFSRTYA